MKNEPKLEKNIGTFAAFSTIMGTVIGAGVFFKVSTVTASTRSASLTLWAWLIGGLLTICGGLTVAELAAAIPETGGAVKYLEKIYGKKAGFLLGWAQTLIYFPANIAALSMIFSTQVLNLFKFNNSWLIPTAILTGSSITVMNIIGNRFSSTLQSITLIVKLIPIALIIIFGFSTTGTIDINITPNHFLSSTQLTGFGGGLLATLFAFDGWLGIGNIAGELKNPKRDLPKVIGFGLIAITIVYLLINFVILKTLPINEIAKNPNAASLAAAHIFGKFGGKLITLGILISVYGAINGYTLTGIRVPYALAKENLLPFSHYLKKISLKTSVPYYSGILQLFIAIVMMLLGSFDTLTDMLVFVMWIFSTLLFIGVIKLRRNNPSLPRPYKVPLYPVLPIIATIGGCFILATTVIAQPLLVLIGIVITCLGLPVYTLTKRLINRGT
ncbi:APC family permease [Pediococcus argentinicus]|uniref:APA family basic amino acid polyamine antiporter n=1 Tax=Pediococcus argentinicus TaxID=480391 RepID=A0A0R2NBK7_9LACO|nr:amino acid permease [Pediococcus argentinicus]KRO22178.1 APA family basic amino acid polyamine antiporter [Pediococcus argentinicus]NKZ22501.1 amino acid permease [Pediococcus argentinicus]GEP20190.1 amino acid permease [Pediococcus argentinicus]